MIDFCNLHFRGLTKEVLFEESNVIKFIITVNAQFIVHANEDKVFREIINQNFATFDGQIPYFFARKKNHNMYFEKLSGSDLIYDFARFASKNQKRMFLLGGYEDSNSGSVEKLKNEYNIDVFGYSPPYQPYPFNIEHNKKILARIQKIKPDIVFVGFGAIKQELWINEHLEQLEAIGVKWVIGSGGTFEFVSGKIKRAPSFIQKIGLEGVWRLMTEFKIFRLQRLFESFKFFKYINMGMDK